MSTDEKQNQENVRNGCIGCAVIIVILVVLMGIFSSGEDSGMNGSSDPEHSMKIEAWVMAQQFVEDQLKSPGTADFGGVWGGDYQDPDECVTKTGSDTYRATGWVDAQNAFGATVRIDFICDLKYLGNEKWRCTSLQTQQR